MQRIVLSHTTNRFSPAASHDLYAVNKIIRKKRGAAGNTGANLALDQMVEKSELLMYTPLHTTSELDKLKSRWQPLWCNWWLYDYFGCGESSGHVPGENRQLVLTQVRDYFGEQGAS